MLLIAIDTSGRNGSVALCRGAQNSFYVGQSPLEGGTYSARLIPVLTELLARHNVSKQDIDAFTIVSGPGSFTGLRVGLATVKGLCEVLRKPLVTVSMLEAVAVLRSTHDGRVTVALDAGRDEVYAGHFEVSGGRATRISEETVKLANFAETAVSQGLLVLTPGGKVADFLIAAAAKVLVVEPVQAGEIGRLGYDKLLAGEVSDPATLDANYIRRSDAELFSAPKR